MDRIHVLDSERLPCEGKASSTQPLWISSLDPGRRCSGAHSENRTHPLLYARYLLEVRQQTNNRNPLTISCISVIVYYRLGISHDSDCGRSKDRAILFFACIYPHSILLCELRLLEVISATILSTPGTRILMFGTHFSPVRTGDWRFLHVCTAD